MNVSSDSSQVAKLEISAALVFFEDCDTAVSLSCFLLLKYKEYAQLVKKSVNPSTYMDRRNFLLDWQCVHLLSKSASLPTGIDPDEVAFTTYLQSEEKCRETNERIPSDQEALLLLDKMSVHIESILGPLKQYDLDYIHDNCRFGPGSTTSVSGASTYSQKYGNDNIESTSSLLALAAFCLPPMWAQQRPNFSIRQSSKGCIVPKNSKTSRCIEIQPDMNIFIQLGIGAAIRRRLLWAGVDLRDQSRNRDMALRGSVDNSLSTVDLSAASDSIALALVTRVIPPRWLHLLELTRVGWASWPDRTILLEKWSAMGNGYTFELESLIFYSLLRVACDEFGLDYSDITVYGDDLIFPSQMHSRVIEMLSLCGFSVNVNKSFGNGLFRESCGADFFDGFNVRPVFFKAKPSDQNLAEICYRYGNSIRNWARRINGGLGCDRVARRAWLRCFTTCPKQYRTRVPLGSDDGFQSNFDEASPTLSRSKSPGWAGFVFRRYLTVGRHIRENPYSYLSALAGQTNKIEFSCHERPPRLRGAFRSQKGYVLAWPDFGPWI